MVWYGMVGPDQSLAIIMVGPLGRVGQRLLLRVVLLAPNQIIVRLNLGPRIALGEVRYRLNGMVFNERNQIKSNHLVYPGFGYWLLVGAQLKGSVTKPVFLGNRGRPWVCFWSPTSRARYVHKRCPSALQLKRSYSSRIPKK